MHRTTTSPTISSRSTAAALAAALVATLGLAACDKRDASTAGAPMSSPATGASQDPALAKSDTAPSAVDNASSGVVDASASVKDAAKDVGGAVKAVAGDVKDKVADGMITTTVHAEFAKDAQLSTLKIDVDTADGHVALKGTAPDAASKDRATKLTQAVKGVVSVDNQLVVLPG